MMRTLHYIAVACALTAAIAVPATMSRAAEEPAATVETAAAESPPPSEGAAASEAEAPELLLFQEIPIVVTASRMEEAITEAPASVSVITREQILNSGAMSIPDILRMAPGVDVQQNTGANWDVSIRGFIHVAPNKVLVLIDGRTVYNDIYATVNWYELPVVLEDIERIEVIRGPLSSLWGANAYLGVINIITRSAAASQGTLATAQYGTRGTFRVNAIAGGETSGGRVHYKVVAGREEVGEWTPYRPDAQSATVDRDKAGKVTKASATAEWLDSRGGRWVASTGTAEGRIVMMIDLTQKHRLWEEATHYASVAYDRDALSVRAYWNGSRVGYYQSGWPAAGVFRTDLYDVEALKSSTIGEHHLMYGASYRRKRVDQGGLPLLDGSHSQDLWAAYVEDVFKASDQTKLVLSARYDQHPLAGGHLSGRATVMYAVAPDQTLRLSAASAFRSPTFLESYVQVIPSALFGNPDLEQEGITSYDLEYRAQVSPATSLDVAVYHSRLSDLIHVMPVAGPPPYQQFNNLGSARGRGAEIEVRHVLSRRLSGFANYTYQYLDADALVAAARNDMLNAAPRHKANLGFTLSDPGRGLNGSLLLNYRDKTTIGDLSAGPYVLVNGYVGKKIAGRGEVGVSFFNLANRKHQQHVKGDFIGRRIMGSVRWEF